MPQDERPWLCQIGMHVAEYRQDPRGFVFEGCTRCSHSRALREADAPEARYYLRFWTALEITTDPKARLELLEGEVRDLRARLQQISALIYGL